jgi:hypothetical protein
MKALFLLLLTTGMAFGAAFTFQNPAWVGQAAALGQGAYTPAFVYATNREAGTAQTTLSIIVTNSANSFMHAKVLFRYNGQTNGITDSKGNTWTRYYNATNTADAFQDADGIAAWYATNCAAGSNLVTLTVPVSDAFSLVLAEFSGVQLGSPLDQTTSTYGTNAANPETITSGSITTTQNGELVIGSSRSYRGAVTSDQVVPWYQVGSVAADHYTIQTTAGAINSYGTNNFNADHYHTAIGSFKHR